MAATHRPRRKLCGQCAQSFFQHRALRWGWWLFWGVIWFCWGARALRAANRIRTASSSAAPASTRPVSGRILNAYSGDELVYNKTLGDWRTHNGIDYAAARGEKVSAPAAGKVTLAGADGSWGPTVAIEDASGRLWRISGVADLKVKAGDTVTAGQALGTVGSVSCECAEDSHIHLEVKQGEKYLDPAKVMQ